VCRMNETQVIDYLLMAYGVFYSNPSVVIQLLLCSITILFSVVFTIVVSTTPFHLSCRFASCLEICKINFQRAILFMNCIASFLTVIVHFARSHSVGIYPILGNNLVLSITAGLAMYTFYYARRRYKIRNDNHSLEARYRMNTISVLACAILLMSRNRELRKRLSILLNLKCLDPPLEFNTDSSGTTYFAMLQQHWQ
ncbi:hypothetical protein PMAYCL1PPCAC_31870, partial [Pristionchus mayeri]